MMKRKVILSWMLMLSGFASAMQQKRESVAWYDLHKITPSMDNGRYYHEVWDEVCSHFGLYESDSDFIEYRCINDSPYTMHDLVRLVNGAVYINSRCRSVSYGMMRFALFYIGAYLKHHDEEIKIFLRTGLFSVAVCDRYNLVRERYAHAAAFDALSCTWCAKQVCDTGILRSWLSDQEIGHLGQKLLTCVEQLRETRPVVVERVLCARHMRQKIELVSESL